MKVGSGRMGLMRGSEILVSNLDQVNSCGHFESRLVRQILIPFTLNFVETFFVYYRTPNRIFARFCYKLRLEKWRFKIKQRQVTLSRNFSESEEIL